MLPATTGFYNPTAYVGGLYTHTHMHTCARTHVHMRAHTHTHTRAYAHTHSDRFVIICGDYPFISIGKTIHNMTIITSPNLNHE